MSKESYSELLLFSYLRSPEFDSAFGAEWRSADDIISLCRDGLRREFSRRGYLVEKDLDGVSDRIVERITHNDGFLLEGDNYTGLFYKLNQPKKNELIKAFQQNHEVSRRIRALGDFALERALRALADENGWVASETAEPLSSIVSGITDAPASDRIVRFDDNQIDELDKQSSELIDLVERQNSLDGVSGFRELVVGQLKAGRELVRAGCVRLYLLETTLIEMLRFLAKRYEREAIGGLAATLLTALAKHIGIDA